MDSGIKTATVRPERRPVRIEKKINFLVQELRHFHISTMCINETNWFGAKWMDHSDSFWSQCSSVWKLL